jgi:hypothetical protein
MVRLRRGDMSCSFLVDEKGRTMIGPQSDRALNENGGNSVAFSAAAGEGRGEKQRRLLTSPIHPIFLYWTDGAKRSLPFALFKSVSLRRSASRFGAALEGWNTPDTIFHILGGSTALNCKLLDDKCRMEEVLKGKPYIPKTRSFDITKEGWEGTLKEEFGGGEGEHRCSDQCTSSFLILKPSLGLKQHGILIFPRCASHLPSALSHVSNLIRPGGLKGRYETWVVQEYVREPLCLSGLDLGMCWGSQQDEWMKDEKWRELLIAPTATIVEKGKLAASKKISGSLGAQMRRVAPSSSPRSKKSSSSSPPSGSPSSSPPRSPLPSSFPPSKIIHTLSPSSPFLPSDSSFPVSIFGLHKLHFRLFAMLRYDARKEREEVYCCNLVKVYHATKPWAWVEKRGGKGKGEERKEQDEPPAEDNTAAETYFVAASSPSVSPSSPLFPPLSSLPSSSLRFSPAFSSPSLDWHCSISKYLSMRLAHDIFPAEKMKEMIEKMRRIMVDTMQEAARRGGFQPCGEFTSPPSSSSSSSQPGLSSSYFQFLGYDFLWDTTQGKPVLLEINNNVGQGLMSQETMGRQMEKESGEVYGHSNAQYEEMQTYWQQHYRKPFVEGVMKINVDRFHSNEVLPLGASEPVRLMSSPPKPDENCWILADVRERQPPTAKEKQ